MLDVLCLDIHMQSPPVTPSQKHVEQPNSSPAVDLQGASHTTSGILCGHAQGNVFNNADAELVSNYGLECHIGWVQVYTAYADPTMVKPDMELKHEVIPKLTEVLKVLSFKYSPVWSNHHIFLHENSVWNIKGHYKTAVEDDEDAMWICHDGEDILQILVVSILLRTSNLFSNELILYYI